MLIAISLSIGACLGCCLMTLSLSSWRAAPRILSVGVRVGMMIRWCFILTVSDKYTAPVEDMLALKVL